MPCYIWKEYFIMEKIILHLELLLIYPKMAKYGSMMELQLKAEVLRRAIYLQWVTKTSENVKVKIWY